LAFAGEKRGKEKGANPAWVAEERGEEGLLSIVRSDSGLGKRNFQFCPARRKEEGEKKNFCRLVNRQKGGEEKGERWVSYQFPFRLGTAAGKRET